MLVPGFQIAFEDMHARSALRNTTPGYRVIWSLKITKIIYVCLQMRCDMKHASFDVVNMYFNRKPHSCTDSWAPIAAEVGSKQRIGDLTHFNLINRV